MIKKLFEIPVYAFNRETLYKKQESFRQEFRKRYEEHYSKENMGVVETLTTYPFRLWDYNHIVGYIRISVDRRDILFNVFLSTPQQKRYLWRSKRKVLLYDIGANGTHFYINEKMTNDDIRVQTAKMLQYVIKAHIPRRYFADTEVFDNLNGQLNYLEIVGEINKCIE